mmetsp:Transcript_27179/g.24061  ORF Transcript_27179/g.24061 Transcript_27179/m.24061 type:complete len:137 (-) Transcript_27179:582-992(-)
MERNILLLHLIRKNTTIKIKFKNRVITLQVGKLEFKTSGENFKNVGNDLLIEESSESVCYLKLTNFKLLEIQDDSDILNITSSKFATYFKSSLIVILDMGITIPRTSYKATEIFSNLTCLRPVYSIKIYHCLGLGN